MGAWAIRQTVFGSCAYTSFAKFRSEGRALCRLVSPFTREHALLHRFLTLLGNLYEKQSLVENENHSQKENDNDIENHSQNPNENDNRYQKQNDNENHSQQNC